MSRTFLEFIGTNQKSNCGYCNGERGETTVKSGVKAGAWAHTMRVNDYAGLLDMGWRRSGRYLYKPNNRVTCCPQFTIRLDVTKFKMSRSQKRAMRQMNEFLATGKRPVCGIKEEDSGAEKVVVPGTSSDKSSEKVKSEDVTAVRKEKDPDRPVLKKKEIRNKRFEEKCRQRNLDPDVVRAERRQKDANRQRTIQSFIDEARPDWKHKLEVKLVPLGTEEFDSKDNESFELYKKYQHIIHKDEGCRLAGFRRFLCDSPLIKEKRLGVDLGSFHLWFLLDGKLIAVSVVDLLPNCLSAKYMYYDPDYSFLSMGTYTALREIDQTQRLEKVNHNLKYYYMGYYIHSCPKMRYKAKFRPSDLLCDESFNWLELDACTEFIEKSTDRNGFAEFCPGFPRPAPLPLGDMLVYTDGAMTTFDRAFSRLTDADKKEQVLRNAQEIARLVGPNLDAAVYYFSEFEA
ncbi:hypothetical protein CAEBREN_09303 [Caenorhabditis brenneri]|uniref:Arginyl-tRNA--protein transferase 1 n=1 Tax=Caenorhabditis brenneri TaxID=135651 RepID=G0MF24_CAEBE|nr:hypothetical protein CAEBREN_09303 [Caenorhabditis brenneri]